jgi:hypothetical protein
VVLFKVTVLFRRLPVGAKKSTKYSGQKSWCSGKDSIEANSPMQIRNVTASIKLLGFLVLARGPIIFRFIYNRTFKTTPHEMRAPSCGN